LKIGFWQRIVVLACFLFAGCAERQLIIPTPQMDADPHLWIRVLMLDDVKECRLKTAKPFSVIDPQSGLTQAYFGQTEPYISVSISGGMIFLDGRVFTGSELIILPENPYIFNLNGDDYRGKLKLIRNPDGNSFDAINFVPLEPYLAGVVGAEMPNYWESAALQAQTIAARTYSLYIKNHLGSKRSWDVRPTAANQVYLGVKAESRQVWDAINGTYGQILICEQPGGIEGLFPAYYSSTCGGHTEDSKNVSGDSFGPLTGVAWPYCRNVAKVSFYYWPTIQFDKNDVSTKILRRYPKLQKLGKIIDIRPIRESNYGKFTRLILVKLFGSTGKNASLRAEDLRLTIDPTGRKLKSTVCQIANFGDKWAFLSGRGYGHGVGMCQCGAEGMAREGKTKGQILSYYYPGSKIVRVY
jgi:stage II sporulation protein D